MSDKKQRTQASPAIKTKTKLKQVRQGEVSYYDASALSRPITMPKKLYPAMAVFVAIAIAAAAFLGLKINDNVVHGDDKLKAQVLEIANRGVEQDTPVLTDFVDYSDKDLINYMSGKGYTYVDMNEINTASDYTLDLFKLPSDMTIEEAGAAFTDGISTLDTKTACKLLTGSWRFNVTRNNGFSYSVRFADFESESANSAIQKAIEQQGLNETTMTETGKDGSGNVFQSGEITIDGYYYTWTVSACDLNEVYKVSGIPSTSQYVGVRLNYDRNAQ